MTGMGDSDIRHLLNELESLLRETADRSATRAAQRRLRARGCAWS
ncbi:MAG: DUF883 family protein [Halochromatium sp.]